MLFIDVYYPSGQRAILRYSKKYDAMSRKSDYVCLSFMLLRNVNFLIFLIYITSVGVYVTCLTPRARRMVFADLHQGLQLFFFLKLNKNE